jgi:dihydroorotase
MSIAVLSATVVDPSQGLDGRRDLLIEEGRIVDLAAPGSLAPKIAAAGVKEVIDAKGLVLMPGLIDLHVHLREPGQEWKETICSGAEAALLGGYTSICCMPNTAPCNDSEEVTRFIRAKAEAAAAARVLPIGAISMARKGEKMAPLSELKAAGCVAFSDDGDPVFDAGLMRRALEWAGMLDAVLSCHEEDKQLSCHGCMNESSLSAKLGLKGWPKVAEEVMVARDIELARTTGARVHLCHLSSARSVELVRRAKNDGIRVTAEVTPHHLVLTEDAVAEYDTNAKMTPPLREQAEVEALRQGLIDGTIDAVASDHAPHDRDQKDVEFSKAGVGILGLQTSLPLVLSLCTEVGLSLARAVEVLSTGPARCFGLPLGTLKKGAAADLSLVELDCEWAFSKEQVHSLSFNSPFLGRTLRGRAQYVLVEGRALVRRGSLVDRKERSNAR